MTIKRAAVVSAAIMLVGLFGAPSGSAVAAPKPPATMTYSDYMAPGSTTEIETQTRVTGVNNSGVKAGYFVDTRGDTHGFTDGSTFVQIDVQGAGSTFVTSINDSGTVAGYYRDTFDIEQGFIGTASGGVTETFVDPALPTDPTVLSKLDAYGTVAMGINRSGVVVGYSYTVGPDTYEYIDTDGFLVTGPVTHYHGFIRSSDGTTFNAYDAPGAVQASVPHVGTRLFGINSAGDMVGAYTYERGREPMDAGFVLSGRFTTIIDPSRDVPRNSCGWHEPHGINDAGVIVGYSGNACSGPPGQVVVTDAWLWNRGKFTPIAYQTGTDVGQWTAPSSINNDRTIGGTWGTGNGGVHGFTAPTP